MTRTCPGCARPAQAVICHDCVGTLVADLKAIAGGTGIGKDQLGLHDELVITMVRLSKMNPSSVGKVSGGPETAVLFAPPAADLLRKLQRDIRHWCVEFSAIYQHVTPPTDPRQAAAWLALFPDLLAMHPEVSHMQASIRRTVRRITRMIDRPPDSAFLGTCGAKVESAASIRSCPCHCHTGGLDAACDIPGGCGHMHYAECADDLYGYPDRPFATCPKCGTRWDTLDRRDFLLGQVRQMLCTATEISRAIPDLAGIKINASTVRWWGSQGMLTKHPPHPMSYRDSPRYKVGEVIDLALKRKRDKEEKKR